MLPVARRLQTPDEMLNRIQDGFVLPINAIASLPILDGRLIETEINASNQAVAVSVSTTPRNIAHGLGRAYRGFIVVGLSANATVWEDPPVAGVDPNPDRTRFVRLDASATANIRLWVF